MKTPQNRSFATKPHTPPPVAQVGASGPGSGAAPPRKRTAAISIGAIGLTAVALIGFGSMRQTCDPNARPEQQQNCRAHSTGSSTAHGSGVWGSSATTGAQPHTSVTRGGFGSTGSAFFSGGG